MKNIQKMENKAFRLDGEPLGGSTKSVSYTPLFIDTRGKENRIEEEVEWKTRSLCLRHGARFHWKNRCARCHYFIRFQERRVG
jgi:hypothetical protein